MNITTESGHPQDPRAPRWLLLIHHLPPKPDYLRVKVRRRLQRLGAVLLKNSVYVLPEREEAIEGFHWLRREIVADGGEATVFGGVLEDGMSDGELEALFRKESDAAYGQLIDAIDAAVEAGAGSAGDRFRQHLAVIESRDYFSARGRAAAVERIRRFETDAVARRRQAIAPAEGGPAPVRNATWVTRRDVFVDRMASAWLIRRYIDPGARFEFVSPRGYRAARGEMPFDMFDGGFTHVGDACTFQTLLSHFHLDDEALAAIGEIVHDIDFREEESVRPETPWVAAMVRGVTLAHADDAARVEAGMALFDALYANLRQADA